MTRASHVFLLIRGCKAATDEAAISAHLGVEAGRFVTGQTNVLQPDKTYAPVNYYVWTLDSPQVEGDLGSRLSALADLIEPFAHQLSTLDSRFEPAIRAHYQSPWQGAEIIEFTLKPTLMSRFAAWNLRIEYEHILMGESDAKARTS
ncbi:MAG TPA: hypothetical protein VEP30_12295 [Chthoniobacterales bacterium]|nr:hypothetical protein [Chthoniobacterales bacterium]